ncbi:hypothetical protein ACLESO_27665 [Pyxidicoccus sp. 3LG]
MRTALALPHRLDVRVGVTAPKASGYTVQVYVRDAVRGWRVSWRRDVAPSGDSRRPGLRA